MQNPNNLRGSEAVHAELGVSQVGVIGLGRMGHVFANLLMAGGVHVTVYDRDLHRVQMVANEGATPASAIGDFTST
jgi:3-hydroxyisobutyrate dehydrogenase-like beta-hydroxyacid dehydrogenase